MVHFSVQTDHVHLIVETKHRGALGRGIQGMVIRIARAVNKASKRGGKVWGDRYHRHDLRTPTEVRNALRYVLLNIRKHERIVGAGAVAFADPWSSGATFDGWDGKTDLYFAVETETERWARVRPWTWLLRRGWKSKELISALDAPRTR